MRLWPPIVFVVHDQQAYLHRTLKSLFAADPSVGGIHALVYSASAALLGDWVADRRVTAHRARDALLHALAGASPGARRRIIARGALELVDEDIVLLQDDLEFAPDWWRFFGQVIGLVDRGYPLERTMIALATAQVYGEKPFSAYPAAEFAGCQALYFGSRVRERMVEEFTRVPRQDPTEDDGVIRQTLLSELRPNVLVPSLPLLAMVPPVVRHVVDWRPAPLAGQAVPAEIRPGPDDQEAAESWFRMYAARIGKTVAWLRGHGLEVFVCSCGAATCEGWKCARPG